MNEELVKKSFGTEWTTYCRNLGYHDPAYNFEQFVKYTTLHPEFLKGKTVLDAGCGNGRFLHLAKKYAKKIIGIDFSDSVEIAREKNPGIHIERVSILDYKPPPNSLTSSTA